MCINDINDKRIYMNIVYRSSFELILSHPLSTYNINQSKGEVGVRSFTLLESPPNLV